MVLVGEVDVGVRVRLGPLQELARRGANGAYLVNRQVVELPDEVRVTLREHGREDLSHEGALAPRPGERAAVPLEMDDAALPGGAREGLLDGTPRPLVGV